MKKLRLTLLCICFGTSLFAQYEVTSEASVLDKHTKQALPFVNIQCLSEEPLLNPTYLKYTVFKNYGLSNETKEVKVIKLYEQQQKVTLDKFIYR